MATIEDVLAPSNIAQALESFSTKRDGHGPDEMMVSQLPEWWEANKELMTAKLCKGTYQPGIVKIIEVATHSGKRREIANINASDRLVERMVQQVIRKEVEPVLLPHCLAYREGKGTLDAALLARDYLTAGCTYVCEIDLQDYFQNISHKLLFSRLGEILQDNDLAGLVQTLVCREIERFGKVNRMAKGLLQGASLSPVLSNLYLARFDTMMEEQGLRWLRFSDNICAYEPTVDTAQADFELLTKHLATDHAIRYNSKKSGIYAALDRRLLGFDFVQSKAGIEVRRHNYSPQKSYTN